MELASNFPFLVKLHPTHLVKGLNPLERNGVQALRNAANECGPREHFMMGEVEKLYRLKQRSEPMGGH